MYIIIVMFNYCVGIMMPSIPNDEVVLKLAVIGNIYCSTDVMGVTPKYPVLLVYYQ